MTNITAGEARKRLYRLVDDVVESHEPIQIAGKRKSAVLLSEEDWRAIQETLYLVSIPGMRESIRKGLKTPVRKCDRERTPEGGRVEIFRERLEGC
jgi:prevent-host-death family protein